MKRRAAPEVVAGGLCAVYKPPGPTSFDIVARIRAILNGPGHNTTTTTGRPHQQHGDGRRWTTSRGRPKVGHGGTLDPFAQGVLVLGVDDGCRLLRTYLAGPKEYIATGLLGTETDTLDKEGKEVFQRPFEHVTEASITKVLQQFVGDIWQKPPAYSALHVNGKRAYEIARSGQEVQLSARQVRVHSLELLDFNPPSFRIRVKAEGGFYVRSLIQELGRAVSSCAHTIALERTQHGPFTVDTALQENHWTYEAVSLALTQWRTQYLSSASPLPMV